MRVLLTGGTGFLGSHIAASLAEAGHELRLTVRATSDRRWIAGLDADTVELDLGGGSPEEPATGSVEIALAGVDAVIHCAGLTRARRESDFHAVNAAGTKRLAERARAAGVGRFVLISSLAARGPDDAAGPISPYGRSKRAGERALLEAAGPMETVVLRPGGIYGPRDSDLLPLFEMAARGWIVVPRSEAPLQPVYVTDVVSATLASLEAEPPAEPLAVLGAGRHDWSRLAEALGKAVGRPGRLVRLPSVAFWLAGLVSEAGARFTGSAPAMDRRRARDLSHHSWTADIEGTRAALDWAPEIDIELGLARTAEWYREAEWL